MISKNDLVNYNKTPFPIFISIDLTLIEVSKEATKRVRTRLSDGLLIGLSLFTRGNNA